MFDKVSECLRRFCVVRALGHVRMWSMASSLPCPLVHCSLWLDRGLPYPAGPGVRLARGLGVCPSRLQVYKPYKPYKLTSYQSKAQNLIPHASFLLLPLTQSKWSSLCSTDFIVEYATMLMPTRCQHDTRSNADMIHAAMPT